MERYFILASGPSMTREDAEIAGSLGKVIAVNNTVDLYPQADILWASDIDWWDYNWTSWKPFQGRKITKKSDVQRRYGLEGFDSLNRCGLNDKCIYMNGNSGGAAISLAHLLGADEIILLGFDMSVKNGLHWHGKHEKTMNPNEGRIGNWVNCFNKIAKQTNKVVNCSRRTELESFPFDKLESYLSK